MSLPQQIVGPGVLARLVRLYPKTSAAVAFEIGMIAASLLKRIGRRPPIVDVTPVRARARRKRKAAPRKRKASAAAS